ASYTYLFLGFCFHQDDAALKGVEEKREGAQQHWEMAAPEMLEMQHRQGQLCPLPERAEAVPRRVRSNNSGHHGSQRGPGEEPESGPLGSHALLLPVQTPISVASWRAVPG
ncbi:unnamed protein product, partial [Gulo gulo]